MLEILQRPDFTLEMCADEFQVTRHVPPQSDFVRDALSITDRKETDDSIDIGMQGQPTLNAHESVSLP